jgi:pimeloyl-ACP methyl ester carboxylesterase
MSSTSSIIPIDSSPPSTKRSILLTSSRSETFTLRTEAAALQDLRSRLRTTRWPDATADGGWSLGVDMRYLRELVEYWAEDFDWPAREAELNTLPHFRIPLGGSDVHFVHARAAGGRPALPLILCHGWPDSFWRYQKVIPLLTDPGAHGGDPADAFDVVVPDMPGYGYSVHRPGPPMNSIEVAALWAQLMTAVGHERFGAVGGDIGSGVSRYLALDHPDRVVAVHRMDAGLPVHQGDPAELTPQERSMFDDAAAWGQAEGAYAALHRTKPQTAAVGLIDSPAAGSWRSCGPGATAAGTSNAASPRTRS